MSAVQIAVMVKEDRKTTETEHAENSLSRPTLKRCTGEYQSQFYYDPFDPPFDKETRLHKESKIRYKNDYLLHETTS
jgi:hypothetical protein